jgi:CRISPR-associated protein Cmr1
MRKAPNNPKCVAEKACGEVSMKGDLVTPKKRDEISFQVELITPIFGGGAKARELDPVCWLRSSAVKASLRFWWRALYGHNSGPSEKMHEAESLIFGKSGDPKRKVGPGLVRVAVTEASKPSLMNPPKAPDVRTVAYFPALGMGQEPAKLGCKGATATISLEFRSGTDKELRNEIMNSLRAWLIFGGAGARTRRGSGAVAPHRREDAEKVEYPMSGKNLKEFLANLGSQSRVKEQQSYFSLANDGSMLVTDGGKDNSDDAFKLVLDHWRAFRQNRRHPNRWGGGNEWGRSMWPEADVIRRQFGAHHAEHAPRAEHLNQAPRALLGIPIHFKFETNFHPGDPSGKFKIVLSNTDRYASPVWLGIARLWEGDRAQHWGVALVTRPQLPESTSLILKGCRADVCLSPSISNPCSNKPMEPTAHCVTDAAAMKTLVLKALSDPWDKTVQEPHFENCKTI